jgi:protein phosphatase 1 regulatory subunit 7
MSPVAILPNLEELYLAQNKLRKISGIQEMKHLRILDLGANRIRVSKPALFSTLPDVASHLQVMEQLSGLVSLKSLWLGKNKIEHIEDLSALVNLTQLDIQCNRLTSCEGLAGLISLQELYLANNNISSLQGLIDALPVTICPNLNTIDFTHNQITSFDGVDVLSTLETIWLSSNRIETVTDLIALKSLPKLECLYLEHNPIYSRSDYKTSIMEELIQLKQLDANLIQR